MEGRAFHGGFRKHQLKEVLPNSFKVISGLVSSLHFGTIKPHLQVTSPTTGRGGDSMLKIYVSFSKTLEFKRKMLPTFADENKKTQVSLKFNILSKQIRGLNTLKQQHLSYTTFVHSSAGHGK